MATKKAPTHKTFILAALGKDSPFRGEDKTGKPYKGVHTRFSGFNEAFRELFGDDPIEATQAAAEEGYIVLRPARGGVTLYLPSDAPVSKAKANLKALGFA
jgi:hypothetical protein